MTEEKDFFPAAFNSNGAPDVQLNLNVRGLAPSATIAINERSNRLIQQGKQIFKLGLGQSPFPVPDPLVQALQHNASQKDYLPVRGLPELRRAVAQHHCREFRIGLTGDEVLIGPGSKELMFILQLVYYGDLVIPTPSWVSYAPQAQIIGRQVSMLPTTAENGWCLTPEHLDLLCRRDPGRPRIVVLNYPSNPTGSTYSSKELLAIAEMARKYRVILLSDEIYGQLHHDGEHKSIVPFYPEGTIFSGGLSKWCGAGGWRLGLFVFPPGLRWLQDAMAVVASETFTSTCAPIQYAAVQAFQENEEIERYVAGARRILKALAGKLTTMLVEAGAHVLPPKGAFYLFPDFSPFAERLSDRNIRTSMELCERLLIETGVATIPGREFGRPPGELTVRIAYVDFDGAEAMKAANDIPLDEPLGDRFLETHCAQPVEGTRRLCEWLNA